jgi:hypothetical protein
VIRGGREPGNILRRLAIVHDGNFHSSRTFLPSGEQISADELSIGLQNIRDI